MFNKLFKILILQIAKICLQLVKCQTFRTIATVRTIKVQQVEGIGEKMIQKLHQKYRHQAY